MKKHGFFRVAAAVPYCMVADVDFNCGEIVRLIKQAHENNTDAAVFPELSLTAYSCGDMFFSNDLQNAVTSGLKYILNTTVDMDIISIVGLPVFDGVHLYNCAAVIQKGKILGVVPKTYIPNYGEFYERRWFASAEDTLSNEIELAGQTVPFLSNIIFDAGRMKIAIDVCEDLWVSTPPSSMHAVHGANVIFNLSASNQIIGKSEYRSMLVKSRSFSSHCAYVYTSSGHGESTTDILYSGNAIIAENGSALLNETNDSFESKIYYGEIDIERLEADRKKLNSFFTSLPTPGNYITVKCAESGYSIPALSRKVTRFPFVPSSKSSMDKRMEEICGIQANALAKRLKHTGITRPVIGISGGLDSTLALLSAVKATDKLRIPRKDVIGITMPGFGTTGRTFQNAKKLMDLMGITSMEISIKDACIQHLKDIGHDISNTDVTYENAQARERTQILMDIANKYNGLVIGTGDLSEAALGWATYGGDHMAMYCVNIGVPKTLVRHLIKWIADNSAYDEKNLLYDIIDTPISPELIPAGDGGEILQKTEEILGDYVLHDFFLYYFLRFGFTKEKILFLAEYAFDGHYGKADIEKALDIFFKRFIQNQFKRSCMPDGPKIGSVALSPRGDLRMASDTNYNLWVNK